MIAVLDEVTAMVNRPDDLLGITARPAAKFARCGRDVAYAFGTEVVDHGGGAWRRRPVGTLISAVYLVDALWNLTVLGQVAADGGDGELEPFDVLPCRCRQRVGVIIEVGDDVGVFVFHQFADEDGQFRLVLGKDAGEADIGQMVVVDVGIRVVGGDEVVLGMQCPIAWHILLQVGAALADDADGRWRDVPAVVHVPDPLS